MNTPEIVDPPAGQKSRWEDYLDVFFAPAELFRRRGNDRLGPPLITLLVLSVIFYYLLLPAQSMMVRVGMAANMPEGGMPAGAEGMVNVMKWAGGIVQPIIYLIMVALVAFVLWLLCRVVGAKPSFRQMMIVTTYAGFIGMLGNIAGMVAILLHGEAGLDIAKHMSFGLNRFMDSSTTPKTLTALLGLSEIFLIWQVVVWGIGVYVITGVSKGKAAIVAGVAWLLMAIPGLIGSMFAPATGAGGAGGASVQIGG